MRAVDKQRYTTEYDTDNPLGRILGIAELSDNAEEAEWRIEQAVLREIPLLEWGFSTIKVLIIAAPLLGLLGTVLGMIETFQAISLFGTGDPKIMAQGISQALEWCYSGRVFAAEEALRGGLVRSLHDQAGLLPAARELARGFSEHSSPLSVAMTRHMMWRMLGADHPVEAHNLDSRAIYHLGRGADAKEGVEAFLEKRPAQFKGRVSEDMPEFFPWWEKRSFS